VKGRRVENTPSELGPVWGTDFWLPGDYGKIEAPEPFGTFWMVKCPDGEVCRVGGGVGEVNHTVEEHEDGTITVSPSIVSPRGNYHGFLVRGEWT